MEVRLDKTFGLANVDFKTTLGPRAKFGEVLIEGATSEEARQIQDFFQSFRARLLRAAVRPGRTFSQRALQNATGHLESRLTDEKHAIVQVKVTGADYNPDSNRADVTFNLERGPIIQTRVEGAQLSGGVQRKLLPVYQKNGLSPELIQEGRQNLLNHFKERGYFEVQVNTTVGEKEGEKHVVYEDHERAAEKDRKRSSSKATNTSAYAELKEHVEASEAHFLNRGRYDDTSIRLLKAFYQSQGFNKVEITAAFVPANGTDLNLTFEVNEGPRDIVEDLQIKGNAVPIGKLVPGGLLLGPGKPFSQSAMDEDKRRLCPAILIWAISPRRSSKLRSPSPPTRRGFKCCMKSRKGHRCRQTGL